MFKSIISFFTGGGETIEKTLDIVSEKVEDVDKRNDLIGRVVEAKIKADSQKTIPAVDAIHKLGRQLMMFTIAYWYYIEWKAGTPIPIQDFMLILGGPGLYTMVKGRGNGN